MITRNLVAVSTVAAAVGWLVPANAATVNQSGITAGGSSSIVNGITVTATGGNFSKKSIAGIEGTGIGGGAVDAEIDGGASISNNESMTFTGFNVNDDTLVSVKLAFLYPNGEFGDVGNEVARITISHGVTSVIDVTATGSSTATSSNANVSVSNISLAQDGSPGPAGAGAWLLTFTGFTDVTQILLQSGNPGTQGKFADFTFVELKTVPIPAALPLFGSAVAGLGLAAWRKRRAAV